MTAGFVPLLAAIGPIAFIVGGIGLGLVGERLLLPRVPAVAEAARGLAPLFCGLLGIELALPSYRVDPEFARRVEDLLAVVAIACVTVLCARFVVVATSGYFRRADLPETAVFARVLAGGVYLLGALIGLETIGVSVTPVLVVFAVAGLAAAIGLKDALAALVASVEILASHQIAPGDYVKLDNGLEGFVTHISWRNTTVRELANNMIVIPNERLARAVFTNYSSPESPTAVSVTIGVDYASDLEHVERVTCEVARTLQTELCGGDLGYDPVVRFRDFAESSVAFRVTFRAPTFADTFRAQSLLIKRLHVRYREEGIVLPFPVRTIEIADKLRKTDGAGATRSRPVTASWTRVAPGIDPSV